MFVLSSFVFVLGGGPESGRYGEYYGARLFNDPGSFPNGFKGVCAVFVTAAFSFAGTELVGCTFLRILKVSKHKYSFFLFSQWLPLSTLTPPRLCLPLSRFATGSCHYAVQSILTQTFFSDDLLAYHFCLRHFTSFHRPPCPMHLRGLDWWKLRRQHLSLVSTLASPVYNSCSSDVCPKASLFTSMPTFPDCHI